VPRNPKQAENNDCARCDDEQRARLHPGRDHLDATAFICTRRGVRRVYRAQFAKDVCPHEDRFVICGNEVESRASARPEKKQDIRLVRLSYRTWAWAP
jgi:hypothetical protein